MEEDAPEILTPDQHFENNGYEIWASGKIYHHRIDYDLQLGDDYYKAEIEAVGRGYLSKEAIKIIEEYDAWYRENRNQVGSGRGPAFEWPDVPENACHDGKMTDMAIDNLAKLKSFDSPFFMAEGYQKPHLTFNAPKKYWDMYDADEIKQADNSYHPENVSEYFGISITCKINPFLCPIGLCYIFAHVAVFFCKTNLQHWDETLWK